MSGVAMPIENISDLFRQAANGDRKTVVIPGGDRPEDVQIFRMVTEMPFINRCILVGDHEKISAAAKDAGVNISREDVVATVSQEESAEKTVALILSGDVDIVLKGNISTPILNRQMLKLAKGRTMSLCSLFQSPLIAGNRPMLLTDAGVTTLCNYSRMSAIIRNAAEVARRVMGLDNPKIALLSANEKVIPSLASSVLAHDLSAAHWDEMTVYGPLSFDLATSPESLRLKGVVPAHGSAMSAVAGQADVLVCPSLDAANILYKTIMALADHGMAQTAGITMGVGIPYIILSRADNLDTKVNSLALCAVYSEQEKAPVASGPSSSQAVFQTEPIILTVNPGSTSTKLGLFSGMRALDEFTVNRKAKIGLRGDRFDAEVRDYIEQARGFLKHKSVDAVVGRGGFLNRSAQTISGGVYRVADVCGGVVRVSQDIVSAVRDSPDMDHPSNYGIPIAAALAETLGVPAFMVDAVVSDDFTPQARFSGYKGIERKSTSHFLSLKAMAAKAAEQLGRPWDKVSLVCAHLGGGISIAAYRDGKIVDNSIALLGGGPFTPQRAGDLPQKELIDLCFSGRFTKEGLLAELSRKGGLVSYLDEDDMCVIQERIANGDDYAREVVEAMAYQIAKAIGAMFVGAGRSTEALVFSGGLTQSELLMGLIRKQVGHLAAVITFKMNLEMEAMARGAVMALQNKVEILEYRLPTAQQV
jgi:butyrate kinase